MVRFTTWTASRPAVGYTQLIFSRQWRLLSLDRQVHQADDSHPRLSEAIPPLKYAKKISSGVSYNLVFKFQKARFLKYQVAYEVHINDLHVLCSCHHSVLSACFLCRAQRVRSVYLCRCCNYGGVNANLCVGRQKTA